MVLAIGIRAIDDDGLETVLAVVNEAAKAYRGKIPADCWHEPYMDPAGLRAEIAAGVVFSGLEVAGTLVGVMGVQNVGNVNLVRHAYVAREWQGCGIGSLLIEGLCSNHALPWLIGTWRAADWAIRFYERHGFRLVPESARMALLHAYWTISDQQVDSSMVLARPQLDADSAFALIASRRPSG